MLLENFITNIYVPVLIILCFCWPILVLISLIHTRRKHRVHITPTHIMEHGFGGAVLIFIWPITLIGIILGNLCKIVAKLINKLF